MRKLLINGDAVAPTGFARVLHNVADTLRHSWAIDVLGINFSGDPIHQYPYRIWPAHTGGDMWGLNRMEDLLDRIRPDMVFLLNDPWNVVEYASVLKDLTVPVVAYMPVDGLNVKDGRKLNGISMAVFYTNFGLAEARAGGYEGPAEVVPHGVDIDTYYPQDREEVRALLGIKQAFGDDVFIVGNVNRNQPRKRIDLTIAYFAEWVKSCDVRNAYLHLHMAADGDRGWNVPQLCQYYGISNRLILTSKKLDAARGVDERTLARVYNAFDVQLTTTQGEGWGLTTMEGMACGIPQICPDWSALGEWARPAALLVQCSDIAVTENDVNVIGGVPDRQMTIEALDLLYNNPDIRLDMTRRGLDLVERPEYRWMNIGHRFAEILDRVPPQRSVPTRRVEEEPKEVVTA